MANTVIEPYNSTIINRRVVGKAVMWLASLRIVQSTIESLVLLPGATQHREITMSAPQGTVTWWSYRVSALNRADTGTGYLVVGTDITAHKTTEQALRHQDRIMQKLQAESAVDLARQVFLAQST